MNKGVIIYLKHADINLLKWDDCIARANNSLIYGYSYYLNDMAENWDGLILNDYEAVMPLIWNKKLGIRYCYQPPFMQQAGWFGNLSSEMINQLYERITSFTKFGDWMFNYGNKTLAIRNKTNILTNYILNLDADYDGFRKNYKTDLLNNLKSAARNNLQYSTSVDINSAITNYKLHYGQRMPHVKEEHYKRFANLCHQMQSTNQCIIRIVKDNESNTISSALLLLDSKRIYNVMNTNTDNGRRLSANHFLYDCIIKEFAESKLIFDFEGSDLPGVKSFYENFGPVNQPYFHWHYNNLPFPINLIKK